MEACLAVLAKFPRPGRVKSRLASHIGTKHAANIQKGMLLDDLVLLENEFADHCPRTMRAIRALHARTR